jgi:CBS domain-containing protein
MSTLNKKNILVQDVMLHIDSFPVIKESVIFKEAIEEMVRTHIGIACVVNQHLKLLGILTDGDIRRKLLKVQKPLSALLVDDALDHAIRMPITISPLDTLNYAVEIMGNKHVWDLPVIDEMGDLVGLLHLHPAVEAILKLKQ